MCTLLLTVATSVYGVLLVMRFSLFVACRFDELPCWCRVVVMAACLPRTPARCVCLYSMDVAVLQSLLAAVGLVEAAACCFLPSGTVVGFCAHWHGVIHAPCQDDGFGCGCSVTVAICVCLALEGVWLVGGCTLFVIDAKLGWRITHSCLVDCVGKKVSDVRWFVGTAADTCRGVSRAGGGGGL